MLPATGTDQDIPDALRGFTCKYGGLADVLFGPVQHLVGREPRQAVSALVRRAGAAVACRVPPVAPGAVVASLAVEEARLVLAEVVRVAVAVTGAGGVLKECKVGGFMN